MSEERTKVRPLPVATRSDFSSAVPESCNHEAWLRLSVPVLARLRESPCSLGDVAKWYADNRKKLMLQGISDSIAENAMFWLEREGIVERIDLNGRRVYRPIDQ